MGRRKGELTLLMERASKWPWKVSVALIPISYLACHVIAALMAPGPPRTGGVSAVIIPTFIFAFATLLQYVLPLIFSVAALISWLNHVRAGRLFDTVRGEPKLEIAQLSWQQFEVLIGEGFRRRGFAVTERGGARPDGGVDLALVRAHERFLVQCKQWRARQVGVSVVRELYGVMTAERVAGGYVVTSGTFTKDAKEFAAGRNIELLDGRGVEQLIREGRASAVRPVDTMPEGGSVRPKPPECPTCKTSMVLRTAKHGSRKGSSFWGCAQYPRCRQTVARA
jgi:restriction system protein